MKHIAEEIKMGLFLFILLSICAAVLSFSNNIYNKQLILQEKQLRMEILKIFGVEFNEETFVKVFTDNVDVETTVKTNYFYYKGTPKLAVVKSSGAGLWSVIELLFIVDLTEKKIKELRILSHAETPGVGSKIEEDFFLSQFRDLDFSEGIKMVPSKKDGLGEVDTISGATVSSTNVGKIINETLPSLDK